MISRYASIWEKLLEEKAQGYLVHDVNELSNIRLCGRGQVS